MQENQKPEEKLEAVEPFNHEEQNGTTGFIQEAYEILSEEDTEKKNSRTSKI